MSTALLALLELLLIFGVSVALALHEIYLLRDEEKRDAEERVAREAAARRMESSAPPAERE